MGDSTTANCGNAEIVAGIETEAFKVIRKNGDEAGDPKIKGGTYWLCECKHCGRKVFMRRNVVLGIGNRKAKSCGCLNGAKPAHPYIEPEASPDPAAERLESVVNAFEQTLKFWLLDFGIPEDEKAQKECIEQLERSMEIVNRYTQKYKEKHYGRT